MDISKYKSFVSRDIPQKFDYDVDKLKEDGYEIKGRFNKTNQDFKEYGKDLKIWQES
ncbi:MAG: hypothetical protein PHO28_01480 [Candidatus Pacebacteria bacterium]|nr:hypothetical protein [Candidatus Paceibacterota bacterium]